MIRLITIITFFTMTFMTVRSQDFTADISGRQDKFVLVSENFESNSATPYIKNIKNSFTCGENSILFNGLVYHTVSYMGRCWLDRNLGAKEVAKTPDDKYGFGDYYQWGRLMDGHQDKNSITTYLLSEIDNPGCSCFMTSTTPPYDWHVPQNDRLWNKRNNNPCPAGWRVASKSDFDILLSNCSDLFSSPLKIPASGYRDGATGKISNTGTKIMLWTSDTSDEKAYFLLSDKKQKKIKKLTRANGLPVRCVRTE